MYCKDCKWFESEPEDYYGDCKHDHIIDVSKYNGYMGFPDSNGALYVSDGEMYIASAYVHKLYGCIHFEKR